MRLYISNFPYGTTVTDLLNLFDEWAPYDAHVITGADGRPAGYGFLHVDEVVAQLAISALNGSDYHGRRLMVSMARNQGGRRINRREKAISVADWREKRSALQRGGG